MKNLQYLWIAALCLTLIGCSRETVNSDVNSTAETAKDTSYIVDETKKGNDLTAESDAENPASEEEEASGNEKALPNEVDEADEEDVKENTSEEEIAVEPKYITIDLSGIKETHIDGEAVEPLKLQIISEEYNNIDWANDWYERENLSLPMIGNEWNHFYDDTYEYLWADDELYIFDRQIPNSDTHCLYVLHRLETDRRRNQSGEKYRRKVKERIGRKRICDLFFRFVTCKTNSRECWKLFGDNSCVKK